MKKPRARDTEIARRQKTSIGATFPEHTQSTGQYPRQQPAPETTDTPPDYGETTKIPQKPPEDVLVRCPRCGMERHGWRGNQGRGVVVSGQTYCCQGCADQTGCDCIGEMERHL
jgi:hypothetical protein